LRGKILGLAFAMISIAPLAAQQRCYFLECPGGAQPTPLPALPPQALTPAPNAPRAEPTPVAIKHAERPRASTEVCDAVGGVTYCGSSVLSPQSGNVYVPRNLVDDNLTTAWVEGKPGDGIGEWILADFGAVKKVTAIRLLNGYHKNVDVFKKNNRVRDAEIIFSTGKKQPISLQDRDGAQDFIMLEPVEARWVQLKIVSVFKGEKFQDTAISEFRVQTAQ
jgi:F5/8 type C domain